MLVLPFLDHDCEDKFILEGQHVLADVIFPDEIKMGSLFGLVSVH